MEKITKPSSQITTPAFDFSKPRLVQISVTDVGACMPLIPQPTTPHSSQKGRNNLTISSFPVCLRVHRTFSTSRNIISAQLLFVSIVTVALLQMHK